METGPIRGRSIPAATRPSSEPFVDQLPGEIDVGAVLKGDDDLRQAELRDRSKFSRPGSPLITCSMGNVICRSTSSGESDGIVVLICTITGVVSGNASIVKYRNENVPAAITNATPQSTTNRLRSEKTMIQLSMSKYSV